MSKCMHEHIQTWRDMETGQVVGLWSCSKCQRKFAPLDASARDSEVERLREALQALLTMLPSDHPERPEAERIPLSYCYVRWQDIRAARALLSSQDKESA